ncbi:Alpha-glucosidase-like protein maltase [Fusarium keratoplasticum]|nr:Alpha-glucosidase-like protein maltase [Fusarium keratoplasticum]
MGYDIADYKAIDAKYGTLSDVDRLINELKKRNMKLMMDLVANHTSDQHQWFQESRSSKANGKRDWYIWKAPRYDEAGNMHPPNNWTQILDTEKSAWNFDTTTQEYYLSLYSTEQPDLNWENADVRHAVHDIMHFWLQRGASGFRMDVINLISKVPTFPDGLVIDGAKSYVGKESYINGPRLHEYLQEMNREVLSKYDCTTVGEMPGVSDTNEVLRVVSPKQKELHMIFIFDLVDIDNSPGSPRMSLEPWSVKDVRSITTKWQRVMSEEDGWNSVFIENHDNPRSVSRYCDDSDEYRSSSAKLLSLFQTTLSGTLFVFQGQELGIRNLPLDCDPSDYRDVESLSFWQRWEQQWAGDPEKLAQGRKILARKSRDHSRTLMPWTSEPHGGFCPANVTPWIRVNDDYQSINVELQNRSASNALESEQSVLSFWKNMLALRKQNKDTLIYGDYHELPVRLENDHKVFAYLKISSDMDARRMVVILNWSGQQAEWTLPEGLAIREWVVSTCGALESIAKSSRVVSLKPWQGLLGSCI